MLSLISAKTTTRRLLTTHSLRRTAATTPTPTPSTFLHTGQIMNSINDLSENKWQPQDALPLHIKELLAPTSGQSPPSNYMLAFLQIIRSLKFQKRTGWLDHGVPEEATESIADHMYRMGVISMLVPAGVDSSKCVKIAIVHDIAEALVGDITPYAGINKNEKHRRELATIHYLSEVIKPYNEAFSKELLELWLDYEEIRNLEARYVKDIDKFEMIQTAWEYEQQFGLKHNLDQFYTSRSAIKTKEIGDLCDALLEKRNQSVEELKKKESS